VRVGEQRGRESGGDDERKEVAQAVVVVIVTARTPKRFMTSCLTLGGGVFRLPSHETRHAKTTNASESDEV
jgi:hypothetical protein